MSFGRKLKIEGFKKNEKNQCWGPKMTFEVVSKTKMTFKNILDYSAVIPAQFPYIRIFFLIKSTPNPEK